MALLASSSAWKLGSALWLLVHCVFAEMVFLDVLLQQGLNFLESNSDVFSSFGAGQHNLAWRENQQANFWLAQVVDQAWEGFWVEIAEGPMIAMVKLLQLNFEANRATGHHILDFEFCEFYGVANLPNGSCVLLSCLLTIHFTLRPCNHHLSILKNKGSSPSWLLQSHNQCGKSLRIVLGISTMITNFQQVQIVVQVSSWNEILYFGLLVLGNIIRRAPIIWSGRRLRGWAIHGRSCGRGSIVRLLRHKWRLMLGSQRLSCIWILISGTRRSTSQRLISWSTLCIWVWLMMRWRPTGAMSLTVWWWVSVWNLWVVALCRWGNARILG